MLNWIKDNRSSFFIAVVIHVLFFAALFLNWQADKPKKIVLQQGNVIEVNAVDATRYDAEIRKIEKQQAAEQKRQQEAEKKAREQKRLLAERKARQERLAKEKKRKAEAELKRNEEKKRKEEQKRKEDEARKIAEKKAAEKKAAQEKKKKTEARAKEEARLKKEQELKAKEKKAREAKRKAEAEQKRQAELKLEQERQQAERARRSKGIVDRHVGLIVQKIERNWRQPLNAPAGLSCKIEIKLASTGQVLGVRILQSSGNNIFDKSVETAVLKASPLPVPTDNEIFQEFKLMIFKFTPGSY